MKQLKKILDDILGIIIGLIALLFLYTVGIVVICAIAILLYIWLVVTGTVSIYKLLGGVV